MKSKKQMRNIFIRRIDNLLINYYKEIDFDLLFTSNYGSNHVAVEEYRAKVMELIGLMEELGLVSSEECLLLREVYGEYFML